MINEIIVNGKIFKLPFSFKWLKNFQGKTQLTSLLNIKNWKSESGIIYVKNKIYRKLWKAIWGWLLNDYTIMIMIWTYIFIHNSFHNYDSNYDKITGVGSCNSFHNLFIILLMTSFIMIMIIIMSWEGLKRSYSRQSTGNICPVLSTSPQR